MHIIFRACSSNNIYYTIISNYIILSNRTFKLLLHNIMTVTIFNLFMCYNVFTGTVSTPPKYPKYSNTSVRLTSFNDCGDIIIPPDQLSQAGFFYAGFGDCVRCFQCGVGQYTLIYYHLKSANFYMNFYIYKGQNKCQRI